MLAVEDAREVLRSTGQIETLIHPYEGGSHTFRYEEEEGRPVVFFDLDGKTYNVDRSAMISAVKKVPGGSESMANVWPLRMIMEPLNHFFDAKGGEFKALTLGDDLIAITRPKTIQFDPVRMLDIMAESVATHGGKDSVIVENFAHGLEKTQFAVTVPEGQAERFVDARPGDRTIGGLYFQGSLLGGNLQLRLRTKRVVCQNGMVSGAGGSVFKLGSEDEEADDGGIARLEEWLRFECQGLYNGAPMEEEFERITHLTQHSVDPEHTALVLEDLFGRFSIPVGARSAIQEALADEQDGTMYGIVQAFTRAAQHSPELAEGVRDRLQRDAGVITVYARELCESCRRPLPE